MTSAPGLGRPRRWAAGLAWGLWALAMVGLAVVPWLDSLLRQAGRPDLAVWVPGSIVGPVVGGAGRGHGWGGGGQPPPPPPGGLAAAGLRPVADRQRGDRRLCGLRVARPGALPAAATVARYYPATGAAALALLSLCCC